MSEFNPADYFSEDRLSKLEDLEAEGVDPFPQKVDRTISIPEYIDNFDSLGEEAEYSIAGRIEGVRDHGGLRFIDVRDYSGENDVVQVMMREDDVDAELYDRFGDIDRGDIVSFTGYPIESNTGEISLMSEDYDIGAKALRNFPEGELKGKKRVRDRTRAIMMDDGLRDTLRTRFEMTESIRDFLTEEDYLEVETPILQNMYGGAAATPFETYAESIDQDMYLRIAPEIALKKLSIGGFPKIFEIGKDFRNEDIDTTHNPEFTMLELYEWWADYDDMMDLTEDLVSNVAEELHGTTSVEFDGEELDFSMPWTRMTIDESIEEIGNIDVSNLSDQKIKEIAEDNGAEFPGGYSRGLGIMELFEQEVEEDLTQPIFITDHPQETTPLCKDHREKEGRIERFEAFAAGSELANSYTELNDPIQQGEHLAEQARRFDEGDEEAHRMDTDFLNAQAQGMPPMGGLGIGLDRLAMLMTDSQSIKEVLGFPMVGREEN